MAMPGYMEPEILDGIKPFAGVTEEATGAERMLMEGQALQQVKTGYTTAVAVQRPRSISRVAHNVLEEAKLAGDSFYYGWEVKTKTGEKKRVEGPSIDLAMCLARHYGNCVTEVEMIAESPTHFMLKGYFIDLESGFTSPRLFRQRKSQSMGKRMDRDRQEDIVFQIGQSKAIRNAIDKAMPAWLITKAIEIAKQAELSKIKTDNMHLARARVMEFFSKYGVTQNRIEAERGRSADDWTPQDIVDLRGMATALKEERIGPDDLFPPVKEEEPSAETKPQPKTESKKPETPAEKQDGSKETQKAKTDPPEEPETTVEIEDDGSKQETSPANEPPKKVNPPTVDEIYDPKIWPIKRVENYMAKYHPDVELPQSGGANAKRKVLRDILEAQEPAGKQKEEAPLQAAPTGNGGLFEDEEPLPWTMSQALAKELDRMGLNLAEAEKTIREHFGAQGLETQLEVEARITPLLKNWNQFQDFLVELGLIM